MKSMQHGSRKIVRIYFFLSYPWNDLVTSQDYLGTLLLVMAPGLGIITPIYSTAKK